MSTTDMTSVAEHVLRTLDITLKNPTIQFVSCDAYVGKLCDGPTTPIVVAVTPTTETPALLAQVSAAAKAAGLEPRDAFLAPPDADGCWLLNTVTDKATVWPAVAIYPPVCYVSSYARVAVTAAKAELDTTARGLAQAVLKRLANSCVSKAWTKKSLGLRVTTAEIDHCGRMYFRPIFVLLHKQGKFSIALATAVCEWARRFPGLLITTVADNFAMVPAPGAVDETAFPPGKENCNWMNVIVTVQEFPTRKEHCDGTPYLFERHTNVVELDFARAAFAAMCAVSKEASAE